MVSEWRGSLAQYRGKWAISFCVIFVEFLVRTWDCLSGVAAIYFFFNSDFVRGLRRLDRGASEMKWCTSIAARVQGRRFRFRLVGVVDIGRDYGSGDGTFPAFLWGTLVA